METAPVSYRTFWVSFMQSDVTMPSIFCLIRDFTSKRGLRSKVAMTFMIITMVFVMVFPTLASAMTGYTANNEAVIKFGKGNQQTPFGTFRQLIAIIHDGSRVNLTDEYMVFRGSPQNQLETCGSYGCLEICKSACECCVLDHKKTNVELQTIQIMEIQRIQIRPGIEAIPMTPSRCQAQRSTLLTGMTRGATLHSTTPQTTKPMI